MIDRGFPRKSLAAASCIMLAATGCAFHGVNSLPLPGAVGRGPDAKTYHVEIANVATLESNSPVMIGDVVVGSVGAMTVRNWHADVEVSVRPDVVVPANVVATIAQTSLLGSMHLALDPPLGEAPNGQLEPGATVPLNKSSTYPSTEKTLSSLSAVVNGGALGQIGDIIHNVNVALSGRQPQIRDVLTRLDTFVGTLDSQRDDIVASIQSLNRLAATFANQRDVISRALQRIPPALDVLIKERPRITTALEKLGAFSDTSNRLVNGVQADLVTNLQNLGPAIKALADIGPQLDAALTYATTYPYTQSFIDRAVRGDYLNAYAVLDLTIPRLKRTLFRGTRWQEEGATLVPAPGEPYYQNYSYDPLSVGVVPPPPEAVGPTNAGPPDAGPAGAPPEAPPMPPVTEPVLPVVQPPAMAGIPAPAPSGANSPIFAGPYDGGR